ncbi:MAG: DinB family protein [Anaerolineae bacterium]|nr:DinB family protein [Anaerolineae bacterium]
MAQNPSNPFTPEVYQTRKVHSVRDFLLVGVDTALLRMQETFEDLNDDEFHWEPLSDAERHADLLLPADQKRVWRVFEQNGTYGYDYSLKTRMPSPFTTIAWIMNHLAQTADMYLYCIKTGRPEGEDRTWDDLPVHSTLPAMRQYAFTAVLDARHYLVALDEPHANAELNAFTPTPWGESRPTYLNLWGGVIEHVIQHTMQIAVRKERIREGL